MFQKTALFQVLRSLGLVLLLVWACFPVLLLFLSTFKAPKEIFKFPPTLIFKPTLVNFADMVKDWPVFFRSLGNSAIVAFGASVLTVLLSTPAGYALSRYRSRASKARLFYPGRAHVPADRALDPAVPRPLGGRARRHALGAHPHLLAPSR